jgi:putative endonuclease
MNRLVRAMLNRLLGSRGERAAERHLRRHGFRLLARGYRTAMGEIDLIAREGATIVFIEVKSRRQVESESEPAEAVTPEKQRRLTLAALHFLRRHDLLERPCRFDVLAIVWPEGRRAPTVAHIRNAFPAVGRGQMFR